MKNLVISLAAGAAVLFVGAANAAPLIQNRIVSDSGVENVRLVCDQFGRCYREPRRRVIIRDSYGYEPQGYARRGYYNGGGYGYYNDRPSVGIGIGPGGFGVGVGPSW